MYKTALLLITLTLSLTLKAANDSWATSKFNNAKDAALKWGDYPKIASFLKKFHDSEHTGEAREILSTYSFNDHALVLPNQPNCQATLKKYVKKHVEEKNKGAQWLNKKYGYPLYHYDYDLPDASFEQTSTIKILPQGEPNAPLESHIYLDLRGSINFNENGEEVRECSIIYRHSSGQGLPMCECELQFTLTLEQELGKKFSGRDKLRDMTIEKLKNNLSTEENEVMILFLNKSSSTRIAWSVHEVLKHHKSSKNLDALIDVMNHSKYRTSQFVAADILGEIGDQKAVPSMIAILQRDKNQTTHMLLPINRALIKLKDPRALPVLEELRDKHPNEEVRSTADSAIKATLGN